MNVVIRNIRIIIGRIRFHINRYQSFNEFRFGCSQRWFNQLYASAIEENNMNLIIEEHNMNNFTYF